MTRDRRRPHAVIASRIFLPEPAAASFRLAALARALRDAGAAVTVLTASVPDAAPLDLPGIRVRTLPVRRDAEGYVRGYASYASFDVPLALRLLGVRRPDVIVAEPPPTTGAVVGTVARLRRVPYVYYAADVWSDAVASTQAHRSVQRALAGLERRTIGSAATVLSVSDGVTQRLAELGVGSRVVTVGNGIDLSAFGPVGTVPEIDEPYLVYAGTASEFQGAAIFAEAFPEVLAEVPGARLIFLGQGTDLGAVARLSAGLPTGSITIEGRRPPEVAARWLRGAAASLVSIRPGVGYDFARPTKIYASAACGTPVVFAGPAQTQAYIRDHGLGRGIDYDRAAVAGAMVAALRERPTGEQRAAMSSLAHESYSLQSAAQHAADAVLRTAEQFRSTAASRLP